jgi:hypothetical protein
MPDKYPLGLNANMGAMRDLGRYVEACRMLNSSHQMAMIGGSNDPRNDIKGVMALHAEIGDPNLQWLIRVYSPLEGDWYKFNVDAYVAYCAEIHRHFPNVIFDAPSNEPGVPDNKVEAFIDNQVELIEKFAAKGIRYAATAYGMGSPHHEHITGGRYDKLIHALAKYDTAYLSLHEYAMGWLEAGSGFSYDILLDPAKLPQYWRTKWEVQPGHYLIRRSDYWALRADALGVRRPRVFLTECPLDQNPDAVTQLNNRHGGVWDYIRYQYGLQKYNFDLRGLNTYSEYWDETFPNLTYDEALAKILIHFVDDCMYVDYVIAGFMFAWNTYWDVPMGTDMSIPERKPTIQLLSNHAKTYTKTGTTPTPPPDPDPLPELKPIRMQGWDNAAGVPVRVRLRATPSTSATVLGELPAAPVVTEGWISIAEPTSADGWIWAYVEFGTLKGWLAMSFVRHDNDIPNPPPLPDYKAWYEADLLYWRQYHIVRITEHTEEILQIDNKLELLRSA